MLWQTSLLSSFLQKSDVKNIKLDQMTFKLLREDEHIAEGEKGGEGGKLGGLRLNARKGLKVKVR